MNFLTIILVYVINMRCNGDICKIQKAIFLENNFWCSHHGKVKTDNGYLYRVSFDVEHGSNFTTPFHYYPETCYSLKSTNLGYIVVRKHWIKKRDTTSFLMSPEIDKFLLKFIFFFTDKPFENEPFNFGRYEGKTQEFVTYKLGEKMSGNKYCINLRFDESVGIRIKHVKEKLEIFLSMNLLKFDEYVKNIGKDKLNAKLTKSKNGANFKLYHFKNYNECFRNLKEFIKYLCHFKLIKDDGSAEKSFDMSTTLKVSQFKKRLFEQFNKNLKKLNGNEADEIYKLLFDEYCEFLKDEMLNNNVFFPIRDKYDIDYYIEKLSNFILKFSKQKQGKSTPSTSKDDTSILCRIINSLKFDLEKFKIKVVKDFCESEYLFEHLFNLLGKNVETLDDHIEVEKVLCDCYNMLVYIFNLYQKSKNNSRFSYSYLAPILIDNYSLRIIDGLRINFNYPSKLRLIRGFDYKRQEVDMIKDNDYFVDKLGIVYCPSEILEMKQIQEIELITSDDENSKRFKVNDYLNF